jgi:hypothetical protein
VALAERLLDPRPGEWNRALMGWAPRCARLSLALRACPVRRFVARAGRQLDFQRWRRDGRGVRVRRAVALVERGSRVLLARRSGALLDGLRGRWWSCRAHRLTRTGTRAGAPACAARSRPRRPASAHIAHRTIDADVWRCTPRAPLPRERLLGWRAARGLALSACPARAGVEVLNHAAPVGS